MAVCVPIRDLKDTARFQLVVDQSDGPVTVTKNGRESMIVMRPDQYDALLEQAAKAELLSRITLAEDEIARGAVVDGREFLENLRKHHG